MALQPELLLLDEPTAYLDGRQTQNLLQELDRIQAQGTTIVMATHNLDLAYAWADWVLVLHEGQLILSDRTDAVFSNVESLQQLQLEIPMLLEIWQALPMSWRHPKSPPKTIAELRAYWHTAAPRQFLD
jgi:cobalt/nickel transport system ATP-binding protein